MESHRDDRISSRLTFRLETLNNCDSQLLLEEEKKNGPDLSSLSVRPSRDTGDIHDDNKQTANQLDEEEEGEEGK